MSMKKSGVAVIVAAVALLGLTACVSQESTLLSRFAMLREDATAGDRLPDEPYDGAYDMVDPDSARYGGEADGARLWIAVAKQPEGVCVVVVPDASSRAVLGCGGGVMTGEGEEVLKLSAPSSREVHLLTDGEPRVDTSAWEQVSENLWVESQ